MSRSRDRDQDAPTFPQEWYAARDAAIDDGKPCPQPPDAGPFISLQESNARCPQLTPRTQAAIARVGHRLVRSITLGLDGIDETLDHAVTMLVECCQGIQAARGPQGMIIEQSDTAELQGAPPQPPPHSILGAIAAFGLEMRAEWDEQAGRRTWQLKRVTARRAARLRRAPRHLVFDRWSTHDPARDVADLLFAWLARDVAEMFVDLPASKRLRVVRCSSSPDCLGRYRLGALQVFPHLRNQPHVVTELSGKRGRERTLCDACRAEPHVVDHRRRERRGYRDPLDPARRVSQKQYRWHYEKAHAEDGIERLEP